MAAIVGRDIAYAQHHRGALLWKILEASSEKGPRQYLPEDLRYTAHMDERRQL
jgi:hypothetical protein